MANPKHVELVQQGSVAIRAWRAKYPGEPLDLMEAQLTEAQLAGARLQGAQLRGALLQRAQLRGAQLRRADLQGADLTGADLTRANLRGVDLRGVQLVEAQLVGAQLQGVQLVGAQLRSADLQGADLQSADLTGADLQSADLREAHLAGAHLQGARLQRAKLREAYLVRADLTGAQLQGADLQRAQLREARLREAHLQSASLRRTHLARADLTRAQLMRADLQGADLTRAQLQGTDLTGASLRMANLINGVFDGAILTDAYLWETRRAGWSIQGVVCEAAYWGQDREERTTYVPSEFERLYADKTKIVLRYEDGIHPIEIATLPALIQQMEARYPGCTLRLRSIEEGPGGATVTLVVDDPGEIVPTEIEALKAELEERGKALITAERVALEAQNQRDKAEYTLEYLAHEFFPSLVKSAQPKYAISLTQGGPSVIGDSQGDIYHTPGQAGAIGRGAHAHDMTFNQLWNQSGQLIDLQGLATELAMLRQHLRRIAVEPDHDVAIGAVAEAEMAAKARNGPKVLEWLSKAGQWVLDNAEKIGVGVATAALKTALGL
jgi:uncharacterized protein YjbI with pentapeptide repeats